ncbi:MAG: anti-sigma factor antagonist [Clostridia bacterium]|nr:anti-sigma factor antagonist [Clostridia bacterium]
MIVNYEETSRTLTINFDGEIDHHSCGEIATISDDAIKKYLPLKLIFDFKNVKFMDSAGIGMVIGRYKQLMRFGGKAEMVNINNDIKRIFSMVGIFKIIPLVSENAESLANT